MGSMVAGKAEGLVSNPTKAAGFFFSHDYLESTEPTELALHLGKNSIDTSFTFLKEGYL